MKRNQPSQRDQQLDRAHGEVNMTAQPEPQLVETPVPTKQEIAASKRLDVRESNIAAREAAMKIKEQQYAEAVEALRLDREAFEALKGDQSTTAGIVVEDLVIEKLKELAGHLPPQVQMMLKNPQLAAMAAESMLNSLKGELTTNGFRAALPTPWGTLRGEVFLDTMSQPQSTAEVDLSQLSGVELRMATLKRYQAS